MDALRACDALHLPDALPSHFAERAWPSYVTALQKPDYWLSCDELLLLCALADVSVAVFERQGNVLNLAGAHMPAGTVPVLVKIDSNRYQRVRSHFERLEFDPSPEVSTADENIAAASGIDSKASIQGWQRVSQIIQEMDNATLQLHLESFLANAGAPPPLCCGSGIIP